MLGFAASSSSWECPARRRGSRRTRRVGPHRSPGGTRRDRDGLESVVLAYSSSPLRGNGWIGEIRWVLPLSSKGKASALRIERGVRAAQ